MPSERSPTTPGAAFERAVETADDAIFVTTADGTITYVNPAFEAITGYEADEAIGRTPAILDAVDHSAERFEDLIQSVESDGTWTGEVVNRRKSGYLYTAKQTVASVGPGTERYVFTLTDTTERKARKERLRQYERAIEGAHDLIAAVDTEYAYIFANERYRDFHGLDQTELTQATLDDVLGADAFERVEPHVEQALAGDIASNRVTRSSHGADTKTFDINYYPLADEAGTVEGVVATMREITDLVEQEQELMRNRSLLTQTERLGEIGGWELDVEGETLRWTHGARRLHDVPDRYEPDLEEAIEYYHRDDRDMVENSIENCREEGVAYDIEVRLVTDDARTRWVNITGDRIQRDGRTILRGAIKDITARKQREQQLMVLNRVLRHNLRNDLTTVKGYAELIQEELTDIEELGTTGEGHSPAEIVGRVSEMGSLSTSLQAELSEIQRLLDRVASLPTETTLEGTELIKESLESLLDISEKVRTVERSSDEDQILEAVTVRPLLEELVAPYRDKFPDATIQIEGDDASIRGNKAALRRIVNELLENALNHADQDSPTVTLRVRTATSKMVVLCVEDTGPGIPEMERQTLEEGEETALMHGSGIGLWLVNWLVTRLGGTVDIESNDPRGATVSVRLPAVDQQSRGGD
ncbi:PAS domain S-box protein [Haloarchaeobius sp. DYHT-AS-18]|uniref:sensor histidine kinase n=1 Tax=Haloarchaeobius sp. DYHT-AS-18 TaxID=3446117 RepID=UPI003EB93110